MDPISATRLPMLSQLQDKLQVKSTEIPVVELEKLTATSGVPITPSSGNVQGPQFQNLLGDLISQVNDKQIAAGEAVNGLITGQNVSLHQAMISMEEASVSFQLMVEVRNKLLESYQELMRMQI